MGKYKMKFELQGLKIEVEGDREDAPEIGRSIGDKIAGVLQVAQVTEPTPQHPVLSMGTVEVVNRSRRRGTKRSPQSATANGDTSVAVIDWKHDPQKWGAPLQNWSTAKKSIWLLYVVGKEGKGQELSGSTIANTFNVHFKQAGLIQVFNVNRDLGKLKAQPNAVVGEDTQGGGSRWFLTQSGIMMAEGLIQEAKGVAVSA